MSHWPLSKPCKCDHSNVFVFVFQTIPMYLYLYLLYYFESECLTDRVNTITPMNYPHVNVIRSHQWKAFNQYLIANDLLVANMSAAPLKYISDQTQISNAWAPNKYTDAFFHLYPYMPLALCLSHMPSFPPGWLCWSALVQLSVSWYKHTHIIS